MMATENPLTYKRATLIEVLKESLAKRVSDRDEAKAKAAEKNKNAVDQLNELITAYPQFLMWLAAHISQNWDENLGTEAFAEAVKQSFDTESEYGYRNDTDEDLNRLIRVYEKAADDTVKVFVTDEVFRYI